MKIAVDVHRIDHPTLVEIHYTPTWWERLLLRRSYSRFASPVAPGMGVWCFDPVGRIVDDETHAAITKAVATAKVQRQVDRIVAERRQQPILRIVH